MVHPAFEPFLRQAREKPASPVSDLSIEHRRREYRNDAFAMRGEMATVASRDDFVLALGVRSLNARLYVPLNDESKALVVYFHGGGFVMGDLDTHEYLCRRLALDTRMRFLAVDYRLAPEHPFPSSLDDVTDAVRYVAGHLDEFANSGARLIVMGDSAGRTWPRLRSRNYGASR